MSKPYYETEEYREAENELDTYYDTVKLVMEYRISEKHKDEQIADIQYRLDVAEKALELLSKSNISNVMEEERQPLIDCIKEQAEKEVRERLR